MNFKEFYKFKKDKSDIISESQNFDFERHKSMILSFIQKIKSNKTLTEYDNPFYKLIVGDVGGSVGAHRNTGFTQEQSNQWKNYFSSNVFDTDGVWSLPFFIMNGKLFYI